MTRTVLPSPGTVEVKSSDTGEAGRFSKPVAALILRSDSA